MFQKSIDYDKCTSCMSCERICANSRVIQKNDQGKPEFKFDYKCIYCGHCLAICPNKAITFVALPQDGLSADRYIAAPLMLDPARKRPGEAAISEFLGATRSNRIFLDKPIEKDKIAKVLDAMVRAPSSGNEQNRNFYILDDKSRLDALEGQLKAYYKKALLIYQNPLLLRLISLISALNTSKENKKHQQNTNSLIQSTPQPSVQALYRFYKNLFQNEIPKDNAQLSYLRDAPVVMIITSGQKANSMHQSFFKGDVTIAATYGTLMAKGSGVAACWLGLLEMAVNKDKKIKLTLGIDKKERVDSALALGYSDLDWQQIPPRGPVKVVWNSTKESHA
jgi:nitroreductase/ferredoxin